MQKGIDIIADVFFSVLNENPKTQLMCIGPVIDLYGKFAALKLEKLMQRFPGRVYSKPEFTALPPCIFSGAEFALIPSRDEPFGLVAVEFGRKGALGVGSKVGGLGQMPGWWYTVESLTSKHLIHQFKQAIRSALASDQTTRANMRAQALVQRFPVQQWVEDLDKLQTRSISVSHQQQEHSSLGQSILRSFTPSISGRSTPSFPSQAHTPVRDGSRSPVPGYAPSIRVLASLSSPDTLPRVTSDQYLHSHVHGPGDIAERERRAPRTSSRAWFRNTGSSSNLNSLMIPEDSSQSSAERDSGMSFTRDSRANSPQFPEPSTSPLSSPRSSFWNLRRLGRASAASLAPPSSPAPPSETTDEESEPTRRQRDRFSYNAIVHEKKDFELQKVDVTFTDSQNEYYNNFAQKLDRIDAKSSEGRLCIEEFLTKSEKAWFGRFHRAKLGMDSRHASPTTIPGFFRWLQEKWKSWSKGHGTHDHAEYASGGQHSPLISTGDKEFLLGNEYEPPNGIRKFLQKKIGDWQLYCFLLAFVSRNHLPPKETKPC
jgi:alpha-1,3-glucan synthase